LTEPSYHNPLNRNSTLNLLIYQFTHILHTLQDLFLAFLARPAFKAKFAAAGLDYHE